MTSYGSYGSYGRYDNSSIGARSYGKPGPTAVAYPTGILPPLSRDARTSSIFKPYAEPIPSLQYLPSRPNEPRPYSEYGRAVTEPKQAWMGSPKGANAYVHPMPPNSALRTSEPSPRMFSARNDLAPSDHPFSDGDVKGSLDLAARLDGDVLATFEPASYTLGPTSAVTAEVRQIRAGLTSAITATKDALYTEAAERKKLQQECEALKAELTKATLEKQDAFSRLNEVERKLRAFTDGPHVSTSQGTDRPRSRESREKESQLLQAVQQKKELEESKAALAAENESLRTQLLFVSRKHDGSSISAGNFGAQVRRLEVSEGERESVAQKLQSTQAELAVAQAKLQAETAHTTRADMIWKETKANCDALSKQLAYERASNAKELEKALAERDIIAKEAKTAREALEQQVAALGAKLARYELDVSEREKERERALDAANTEIHRLSLACSELTRQVSLAQFDKDSVNQIKVELERRLDARSEEQRQQLDALRNDHQVYVKTLEEENRLRLLTMQQEHERDVRTLQRDIHDAKTDREQLVGHLRDRLAQVSKDAEEAACREIAATAALNVEISHLAERSAGLEQVNAQLQQSLERVHDQVALERKNCASLRATVGELEARNLSLESKMDALNGVLAKERAVSHELLQKVSQLEDIRNSLDAAVQNYKGQVGKDRDALRTALQQLGDLQSDKAALDNALRMLNVQLENERSACRVLENSVQFLNTQLEQERAAQAAQNDGVRLLQKQLEDTKRAHTSMVKVIQVQLDDEREARLAAERLVRSLQIQLEAYKNSARAHRDSQPDPPPPPAALPFDSSKQYRVPVAGTIPANGLPQLDASRSYMPPAVASNYAHDRLAQLPQPVPYYDRIDDAYAATAPHAAARAPSPPFVPVYAAPPAPQPVLRAVGPAEAAVAIAAEEASIAASRAQGAAREALRPVSAQSSHSNEAVQSIEAFTGAQSSWPLRRETVSAMSDMVDDIIAQVVPSALAAPADPPRPDHSTASQPQPAPAPALPQVVAPPPTSLPAPPPASSLTTVIPPSCDVVTVASAAPLAAASSASVGDSKPEPRPSPAASPTEAPRAMLRAAAPVVEEQVSLVLRDMFTDVLALLPLSRPPPPQPQPAPLPTAAPRAAATTFSLTHALPLAAAVAPPIALPSEQPTAGAVTKAFAPSPRSSPITLPPTPLIPDTLEVDTVNSVTTVVDDIVSFVSFSFP